MDTIDSSPKESKSEVYYDSTNFEVSGKFILIGNSIYSMKHLTSVSISEVHTFIPANFVGMTILGIIVGGGLGIVLGASSRNFNVLVPIVSILIGAASGYFISRRKPETGYTGLLRLEWSSSEVELISALNEDTLREMRKAVGRSMADNQ